VITILIDCSRCLAKQVLAFRERGDDTDGNYRQLVELISRWVPFLKNWLYSRRAQPYKATYLSWQSQNEFILLISDAVRDKICDDVRRASMFTVMADTTPGLGHLDQLSLVVRYVDEQFRIQERLLTIDAISDKTGDGFAAKVVQLLQSLGFSTDMIKFQCYDTTSSMTGKYNGAQAKLSERVGRQVPYVPCLGHKTNLCVEHACEASPILDSVLSCYRTCTTFLLEVRVDSTNIRLK
jgi:hypothetical protein